MFKVPSFWTITPTNGINMHRTNVLQGAESCWMGHRITEPQHVWDHWEIQHLWVVARQRLVPCNRWVLSSIHQGELYSWRKIKSKLDLTSLSVTGAFLSVIRPEFRAAGSCSFCRRVTGGCQSHLNVTKLAIFSPPHYYFSSSFPYFLSFCLSPLSSRWKCFSYSLKHLPKILSFADGECDGQLIQCPNWHFKVISVTWVNIIFASCTGVKWLPLRLDSVSSACHCHAALRRAKTLF